MAKTDTDKRMAFLMIDFEMPELIKDLQNKIPDDEVYNDPEDEVFEYGKERETHVTLAACLDNDVDLDKLKEKLHPLDEYEIILTDISVFENPKYDVLKCGVGSKTLHESNAEILKDFKSHSEFKEYKPHVTIAYLKPGNGKKYTKDVLDKLVVLKPKNFCLSYFGENGERKRKTWK